MFAVLAGASAAIGAGLVSWPVIGAVANSTFVGALRLSGTAAELAWALPLGVTAGIAASGVAGLTSHRAWPRTAFGAWLIWTLVMALLLGMRFVPPMFAVAAATLAFVSTSLIASRWRPRPVSDQARPVLAGLCGFGLFAVAIVALVVAAVQVRPAGVTPDDWRRYKDPFDVSAAAAIAVGASATIAIASVGARRTLSLFVALIVFAVLFVAATPMLGFLSSCYVGEVLVIFRWLVNPNC